MRILSGRIALLLAASAAFSAAAGAALMGSSELPASFGDALRVAVVDLEVYAHDPTGAPVVGLFADDFEIYENGWPVELTNFYAVEAGRRLAQDPVRLDDGLSLATAVVPEAVERQRQPSYVVVYVDNHNLSAFYRNRLLGPLAAFLRERIELGDQVMLVTSGGSSNDPVRVRQPPTRQWPDLARNLAAITAMPVLDRGPYARQREMLAALNGARRMASEMPCTAQLLGRARAQARMTFDEVRTTLSNLRAFSDSLAALPGRKAMLYISDGLPLSPGRQAHQLLAGLCSTEELARRDLSFDAGPLYRELARHANANRVTFFTLEAAGTRLASTSAWGGTSLEAAPLVDPVQVANLQASLLFLAAETGGRAVLNTTAFAPALATIGRDLDSYYSLGYRLQGNADGQPRQIEVRVKKTGVRLQYRKSFLPKSGAEQMADLTLGTLFYGAPQSSLQQNPLGIALEVGSSTAIDGMLFTVPVRLRIPLGKLALVPRDGARRGRLTVQVGTRDREGRLAPLRSATIPISIPESEAAEALGKVFVYEVRLLLRAGEHVLALGLRDEVADVASFLVRPLAVEPSAVAKRR